MCHILLKIVKIKKHWLNDTCNRSSYRAIKDHLTYLQEDFYGKPSGVGESFRKEQRKESTRTHSEPLLSQSRKPATPPHPSMSSQLHSRHSRNIQRNRALRSSIYKEMVSILARSLQETYQNLGRGKIKKPEAMHLDPPDLKFLIIQI